MICRVTEFEKSYYVLNYEKKYRSLVEYTRDQQISLNSLQLLGCRMELGVWAELKRISQSSYKEKVISCNPSFVFVLFLFQLVATLKKI